MDRIIPDARRPAGSIFFRFVPKTDIEADMESHTEALAPPHMPPREKIRVDSEISNLDSRNRGACDSHLAAPSGAGARTVAVSSTLTPTPTDAAIEAPPPPPSSLSPPSITTFQLIVAVHETTYQTVFRNADLAGFKFKEARVDRILVTQPTPRGPHPNTGPPPPPPSSQPSWRQAGRGWGGRRGRHSGSFSAGAFEVHDSMLVIDKAQASNSSASYKITLDRRLRPVVLAVHRAERCVLPFLGLKDDEGAADDGNGCAVSEVDGNATPGVGGSGSGGNGSGSVQRRTCHEVTELKQALQDMIDVIFREKLMEPCGAPGSGGISGGGASEGVLQQTPTVPPLVIHANEGGWRDSAVIHLKAPVSGAREYIQLLGSLLARRTATLLNHDNDAHILERTLHQHHDHMMSAYKSQALQDIMSNFTRLGDAQQLLESRPEMFFRVADESGQLSGGKDLAAVWYGCKAQPSLIATLPGRAVNGLSLEEVLDCMKALWKSDLRRRLFEAPGEVKKAAGLGWCLVPCFA